MGIWYEAMMRWLGPAQRVTAMSKVAVPRRGDGTGAPHDVRVPDHVDILAQLRGGAGRHPPLRSGARPGPGPRGRVFRPAGTPPPPGEPVPRHRRPRRPTRPR